MIGTIRKHAAWLWWLIAGLTIISFVYFMGFTANRNGGGSGGQADYGTAYGHQITPDEFASTRREFFISYWMQRHEWPDKSTAITEKDIEKQTYISLLLGLKAKAMGIHIPDDSLKAYAAMVLQSVGRERTRDGQAIPIDQFVDGVLKPEGLSAEDFQRYIQSDLSIQQLVSVLGLPGTLLTPQEAGSLFDREYQEASVQAVFFGATNYLDQVSVSPAEVGQFFTNYMTEYRLPDRIQVYYLWWNVTNFTAQSKSEWAKTNFEETVTAVYNQHASQFADAKTPEEAKTRVRALLIRDRAINDAAVGARDFISTLYAMDPVKFENFVTVAKQKGFEVRTSAPFSENDTALEFINTPSLQKTALTLTADSPFSSLIQAEDGIYAMGLASQLPSSIPSFSDISARVTEDARMQKAAALAQAAGTNFYTSAKISMALGKTFAQAALTAGRPPVMLTEFSRSSTGVPEINEQNEFNYIKNLTFSLPVGGISPFIPTPEGGFVLQVKSLAPIDPAKKAADLPGFMKQIRQARENESFQIWVNNEINRELRNNSHFMSLSAADTDTDK